jgi:hypothetical protein
MLSAPNAGCAEIHSRRRPSASWLQGNEKINGLDTGGRGTIRRQTILCRVSNALSSGEQGGYAGRAAELESLLNIAAIRPALSSWSSARRACARKRFSARPSGAFPIKPRGDAAM